LQVRIAALEGRGVEKGKPERLLWSDEVVRALLVSMLQAR
jgi:hypothetical protein